MAVTLSIRPVNPAEAKRHLDAFVEFARKTWGEVVLREDNGCLVLEPALRATPRRR